MIRRNLLLRIFLTVLTTGICLVYSRILVDSLVLRDSYLFSGLPCVIRSDVEVSIFITPRRYGLTGVTLSTAMGADSPDIQLEIRTVPEGKSLVSVESDSDSGSLSWRFRPLYEGLGNPLQLYFTRSSSGDHIFLSCTRQQPGISNRERPEGFLLYEYGRGGIDSIMQWFDDRINPFLPLSLPPVAGVLLFLFPPIVAGILTWRIGLGLSSD